MLSSFKFKVAPLVWDLDERGTLCSPLSQNHDPFPIRFCTDLEAL